VFPFWVTPTIDIEPKILMLISKGIVVLFTGAMLYHGTGMVTKQMQTGQTSPGLGIPMWLPYFSFVLCFGIMFCVQLVSFIKIVATKTSKFKKEEIVEENIETQKGDNQ
jgi:TRAP-type C4-dicarboxylate transport system permease small subunit